MKKFNIDESGIEELLSKLPKVTDDRDPDEIFQQIIAKMDSSFEKNEQENIAPIKRKKTKWMPFIGTAAAVGIIAILAPSFMQEDAKQLSLNETNDKLTKEAKTFDEDSKKDFALEQQEIIDKEVTPNTVTEVPKNKEIVSIAIPDEQAQVVVPITIVKPEENKTVNEKIDDIERQLAKADLGLGENVLEDVEFEEQSETSLIAKLPENSILTDGSTGETVLIDSIVETFKRLGYEEVIITKGKNPSVYLSHSGFNTLKIETTTKKVYYRFQAGADKPEFLVPVDVGSKTLSEALTKATLNHEYLPLKSAISPSIKIEKVAENNLTQAEVTFSKETVLENDKDTIMAIEAILLTAGEFGYKEVMFKGENLGIVGIYNLAEPIKVPVAPNPVK